MIFSLQHISKLTEPLQDISFHVNNLNTLTIMLNSLDFPLDGYKKNGLQSRGNLAIYASQNLRDYIFKGEGSPNDEGIILKLHFASSVHGSAEKYDGLSYFIHGKDFDEDVKKAVSTKMALLGRGNRSRRSIFNKLIT